MISIIVPHYCTLREYFEKCMNSLLDDKDADIEVLIIDDGSPAEYIEYIQTYTEDKRVRVIYESHKGVSNARNIGIKEASGDWMMFVDADDYLEKGYYSILASLTVNTNADFIFFNGYGDKDGYQIPNRFYVCENVDYGETLERKCEVMGAGLSLGRTPVYRRCFFTLGSPYAKLIKTSYIRDQNITFDTSVRFAEDTLFSLNLIFNAHHIYYANYYLYHYYMNELSATGKYRKGLSADVDGFFIKTEAFIDERGLRSRLQESYYIRAFLEAQRCIRQEFYHKDNSDDYNQRHEATAKFLNQELYQKALKADYPYMRKKACKVASFLLKKRQYGMYIVMYKTLGIAKKLIHSV
ncbi:glycosyltransferase family 2 protein [Oribacterium sp. NK2B42]|uniref:glycosyltransferase family 2 protein n=1 Tax=Oribacterium sp. NK2B42 TaxID=689781 RepID=UPI000413D160|nr:glycosyltransferase family A protein [Oribacterium sp. NK2B42]